LQLPIKNQQLDRRPRLTNFNSLITAANKVIPVLKGIG